MKYKKILMLTFIMLAILSVGAVSASEDADMISHDSDAIASQDNSFDNEITAVDESTILGDGNPYMHIENAIPMKNDSYVGTIYLNGNVGNFTVVREDTDILYQKAILSGDDQFDLAVSDLNGFLDSGYADLISFQFCYEIDSGSDWSVYSYFYYPHPDEGTIYLASDGIDPTLKTTLTSEDINTNYNSNEGFLVSLVDYNNRSIKDARIDVDFGEFIEMVYTDELGLANVSVRGLKPGNYTPFISYNGDVYYAPSNTTANVVITRTDSTITALNTIVPYNSGEYFLIYLEDAYRNPIYDAAVTAVFGEIEVLVYTDEIGWANVSLSGLKPGAYSPVVKFDGDECFYPSSTLANVVITKADSKLYACDVDTEYNSGECAGVYLEDVYGCPINNATIISVIDELMQTNYTDEIGWANVSLGGLVPGGYVNYVMFMGDDCYNPSNGTSFIEISKANTHVTTSYANGILSAFLTDDYGNPVTAAKVGFANNGVTYIFTDDNGEAKYSTQDLPEGTYTVRIKYYGDSNYNPSNQAVVTINVTKPAAYLNSSDVTVGYHDDAYLVATLRNENGTPISGAKVGFANNGVKARYSTINLTEGTYTVKMKFYGNDEYGASNQVVAKINVTRLATNLTSADVHAIYHDDAYLVATLRDGNGTPISGAKVGFANNGVKYILTDENGEARYSTINLTEGTYTVKMKFYGNDIYSESNQEIAKIVIGKIETTLNSSDVNVKYGSDDYLVASLKDGNGNPIVGAKVGFANNGVTYIETDENGEAKYSTKGLDMGTYTVKMKYYGNDTYQESNQAIAKITVADKFASVLSSADVHVIYDEDGYLVATLKDANGNPIIGAKVGFANNGVKYFYTDENGEAKYSTKGLDNGTYTVKMKFYGNDMYAESNQISARIFVGKYVPPSLTSDGVTTTYGADDYLVATLTGMDYKPIVGAKILFTVFGNKIVDITDSSGHAKISTKGYSPGIYNVMFKFAGNSLYSEATSSTKMIINRA